MKWVRSESRLLEGTYLKVVPNAAGGWFVVDWRNESEVLGQALTLWQAKTFAERLVEKDERWRRKAER